MEVWLPQELAKNLATKVVIYRQGNKLGQEVSACIANIVTGDSDDNLTGQCQPKLLRQKEVDKLV